MSEARWSIAPYFVVEDVVAAANFYRDKLGFQYERFWGEPPAFCMVWRRGVVIMLSQFAEGAGTNPNAKVDREGEAWDAYIWVDAVDALFEEFQSKGVTIARPICDQEYGCRDFDVLDSTGYRLCFGQDMSSLRQ